MFDEFNISKKVLSVPAGLVENIYELKKLDLGTPKTNYGGWHSKTFTPYRDYYNGRYKWTAPIIELLIDNTRDVMPNLKLSRAWFNLSYEGSNNRWHDHGKHPLVCVYYIQVPPMSSDIEFRKNNQTFSYTPSEGDFLMFPGHLEHRVQTHKSYIDRISLAINLDSN